MRFVPCRGFASWAAHFSKGATRLVGQEILPQDLGRKFVKWDMFQACTLWPPRRKSDHIIMVGSHLYKSNTFLTGAVSTTCPTNRRFEWPRNGTPNVIRPHDARSRACRSRKVLADFAA